MLTNVELRELSQISGFKSSLSILLDWMIVALIFALAIGVPHPLTYIFCAIMMGRQQIAFAILMHDGAHKRLYKSSVLNEYIGQFLTAAPLFFSMFSYRKLHLKHHRDPLVSDDPDISLTGGYPVSKASFIRKLLRDLFGISYFKFIRYFIYLARSGNKAEKKITASTLESQTQGETRIIEELSSQAHIAKEKVPFALIVSSMFIINGLMWGILFSLGHGWLYLLWIVPMMTVLQVLLRIRGVAEHAGYQPNKDQRLNSRTVINPLQTFFFAPHGVFYHVEHHQYPSVPFYNLPTVHKLMKERGSLPETNVFSGYGPVLKQILK